MQVTEKFKTDILQPTFEECSVLSHYLTAYNPRKISQVLSLFLLQIFSATKWHHNLNHKHKNLIFTFIYISEAKPTSRIPCPTFQTSSDFDSTIWNTPHRNHIVCIWNKIYRIPLVSQFKTNILQTTVGKCSVLRHHLITYNPKKNPKLSYFVQFSQQPNDNTIKPEI